MSEIAQVEIFAASNAPGVSETGGGHGQKGVDFQRYWAISRIIELMNAEQPDFLVLFETLQDVAILDSAESPTSAQIYQVKMKNTGEWKWKALTALPVKAIKKKNSEELTIPLQFNESPIGKLAATVAELDGVIAAGTFVSNLGCDAELQKGSTAGAVTLCKFSELSEELQSQITPELKKLKRTVPLDSLTLHRTDLSLDEPHVHVSGKMHEFLSKTAPRHKGQCRSFSDTLFATLSARGRRIEPAPDFATLVSHRGYSKKEFVEAVETLRSIPDKQELVNGWLYRLLAAQMPIFVYTKLQIKLTRMLEAQLRSGSEDDSQVSHRVREWVAEHVPGEDLLKFINDGVTELGPALSMSTEHLQAVLILAGISLCLSQTSEN